MITNKRNAAFDGHMTFAGGMHSGIDPTILDETQCSYSKNVTFRGTLPSTRPGFRRLPLTNQDANFDTGIVQGLSFYRPAVGLPCLVGVVNGRIYRFSPDSREALSFRVEALSQTPSPSLDLDDWDLNPKQVQAYFQQVNNDLVIQNDHDRPRIYDNWRLRVTEDDEVPTGGPMAFGQGRLFVAKHNKVYAGDIDGGPTSPLQFTEDTYFSGGGYFAVPTDANGNGVRGMRFISVGDTGTGQGELVCATSSTAHTLNVSAPRSSWQDIDLQKTLLLNSGAVSHKGMTSVNEDIWMRAEDGERSLKLAISEQKVWSRTPASTEIRRILDYDDPKWVHYTSSTLFDNRLIWTVGHRGTKEGAGFAVLDFDPVSALGQQPRPVYDGFWELEGVEPIDIITADFGYGPRCIFIGKETATGHTGVWEITKDASSDDGTDIIASVETRAMQFQDPFAHKAIDRTDIFIKGMKGSTSLNMDVRADSETAWVAWDTKTRDYDWGVTDADVAAGNELPIMPDQGWTRMTFGTPQVKPLSDSSYPTLGVADRGATFQLRLNWTGRLTVARLWVHCHGIVEQPTADVD